MTTILSVRDLKKVIGKKTLVEDISFDVKKGEVFGFLWTKWCWKDDYHSNVSRIDYGDRRYDFYRWLFD